MNGFGESCPRETIDVTSFLRSFPRDFDGVGLTFKGLGKVGITTLTHANLSLLRRAVEGGHDGVIVSCPDFVRESVATAFLASFKNLIEFKGGGGLREPVSGERVAVGRCVVDVVDVDEEMVRFDGLGINHRVGLRRDKFPLVHSASGELTRLKKGSKELRQAAEEYDAVAPFARALLDRCGSAVPAVGIVSSSCQYLDEPPTRILNGSLVSDGHETPLSDALPLTYLSPEKERNGFDWPFDVTPSILLAPRSNGVGDAFSLANCDDGTILDFVSINIPESDVFESEMLPGIRFLVKRQHVPVIGFCDRWTLDKVSGLQALEKYNFLIVDWDWDWGCCEAIRGQGPLVLSATQRNRLEGSSREAKLHVVPSGDSGLSRVASVFEGVLRRTEMINSEALVAKQHLFRYLASALRLTMRPDENYCFERSESIKGSLNAILKSSSLTEEECGDLQEACRILASVFNPTRHLPKEDEILKIVSGRLGEFGQSVTLVVDTDRTERAFEYWRKRVSDEGLPTDRLHVVNVYGFIAEKGSSKDKGDSVVFCGWYDRGTMDRAIHSGISSDVSLVLYAGEDHDLEVGWYNDARIRWQASSERCAKKTDESLSALGFSPPLRPKGKCLKRPSGKECEIRDTSPAATVVEIDKKLLESDIESAGEDGVRARPVLFDDGSHVWLSTDKGHRGKLTVITACLAGLSCEPVKKGASALLQGDVVTRTKADRSYIWEASASVDDGHQADLETAQRWKAPIKRAQERGMTDAEIISRIRSYQKNRVQPQTVRTWITDAGKICPRKKEHIRSIFVAMGEPVDGPVLDEILEAAERVRGSHRKTSRLVKKEIVNLFLDDVAAFGLDDALEGFDRRHSLGTVELLRVMSIGEEARVSENAAVI